MHSKISLIILTIFALISFSIYYNFRQYAFPEHSIQFEIDQPVAEQKALSLASQLNINLSTYKKATLFEIEETAKNYLEREFGAKKAGELAKSEVDLWHFIVRFYRPLQKEEVYTAFSPKGDLVSFTHNIDESVHGRALPKDDAETIAKTFLYNYCRSCHQETFNTTWKLIEYSEISRPNRKDHSFTYEKQNYSLNDAKLHILVRVQGDQIGYYNEFLKVPQNWVSNFNKEKSYNEVAQTIAEVINTLFISLPMILLFFIKYKDRKLYFRIPHWIALVVAIVTVVGTINQLSEFLFDYPNTQSQGTTAVYLIGQLIITWLYTYLVTQATISVAESVYRDAYPNKASTFDSIKNLLRVSSISKSLYIGVCVGIIAFLYEILYYFLGQKVGFWVPADINYSDAFNSLAPWVYPLTIGLLPAISEEVTYRLFALSLFKKYLKNPLAAVLLSSMMWAFLHSAYPQTPYFVRGLELTVVGLVFGYIFLKYGILASIAAHYTFNALQLAVFFFNAKSSYVSISALVVALLPLWLVILGKIIQALKHPTQHLPQNHEIDLSSITDSAKSTSVQAASESNIPLVQPTVSISKNKWLSLLGILMISTLFLFLPHSSSSGVQSFTKNKTQITQTALSFLKQRRVNLNGYQTVTTVTSNSIGSTAINYLKQNTDRQTAQFFLDQYQFADSLWSVRVFKPQQKEEYTIYVRPDGKIETFTHTLAETASGPRPTEAEALNRAMDYLSQNKVSLQNISLIDKTEDKKDNRTDYSFVFEDKRKIAKASWRFTVDVVQGEPQYLRSEIKLPEQYEREISETKWKNVVSTIIELIVGMILLSFVSTTIFGLYKNKQLNHPIANNISLLILISSIISQLNNIPTFYESYNTDLPQLMYLIIHSAEIPISIITTYLLSRLIINAAMPLYQQYIGPLLTTDPKDQRRMVKHGLILAFLVNGILITWIYAQNSLLELIHPTLTDSGSLLASDINSYMPALEGLKNLPLVVLSVSVFVVAAVSLRKYAKSWRVTFLISLIFITITSLLSASNLSSFTIAFVESIPITSIFLLLAVFVIRNNIFYYIFSGFFALTVTSLLFYLEQPNPTWTVNGLGYLLITLIPLILWLGYGKISYYLSLDWFQTLKNRIVRSND